MTIIPNINPSQWSLPTQRIGCRILSYDCVDSTNSLAASFADDPANDGLVILADEQSAGRGRHGRSWQSPPGSGILLSVLLFPPEPIRRPVILTTMAAVAVCETIYRITQLQARIKWPNDVLIQGRKVCGILVEQGQGVVIGLGLNVNTPAEVFADAELAHGGSLATLVGETVNREKVINDLILQLDASYAELCHGHLADLESRWRWHSGLLGKFVAVRTSNGWLRGRIMELSFSGIVFKDEAERIHSMIPETVEQITLLAAP